MEYLRKQHTCVKCARTYEASTGYSFARACVCGNEIICLVWAPDTIYVIAETPEAAEKVVRRGYGILFGYRHRTRARGVMDELEMLATAQRWLNQPDPMRQRYAMFGVRKIASEARERVGLTVDA